MIDTLTAVTDSTKLRPTYRDIKQLDNWIISTTMFQSTALGSLLRAATGSRFLKYPEEEEGFQLPSRYSLPSNNASSDELEKRSQSPRDSDPEAALGTGRDDGSEGTKVEDGIAVVTWYSEKDPENPHNWSSGKKTYISATLFAYTFAAYIGSSIYTASIPGIRAKFGASEAVANLGLSLYVWGYGFGPMIFSPLSEIPSIGRNPPYAVTFSLFAILTIPMALIDNIAGMMVLRFLLGVMCSPSLATVGASYGDFYSPNNMEYVIAFWGGGASLAPALGPVIAAYAVAAKGWRWSSWELLWLAWPIAILLLLTLPETSADTILLRRAQRLRALTGRIDLMSQSEIRQKHMNAREIAFNALIKPWEINALDPAVLFSTIYMALVYGTYYSFFESFPLVFEGVYGFSAGSLGLSFLSIMAGLCVSVVVLVLYIRYIAPKRMGKMDAVPPEARLYPGLFATFLIPIGLFIFAWTARSSIHWIVCMIGLGLSMCGVFFVTQCILLYIPFTYPQYAGSLFAANSLSRALFAGAAVLFSPAMFRAMKVSGGVSLLAGCSVMCVFGMYALYYYGERLRKRSRFAV
ncbi:Fc.00g071990.m01.CDS01 [Cosmosporella sp. VM-42]